MNIYSGKMYGVFGNTIVVMRLITDGKCSSPVASPMWAESIFQKHTGARVRSETE